MRTETRQERALAYPLDAGRKEGGFRYLWKNRILYAMLLPVLILTFFNSYLPMGGVIIAFKSYNYTDGILKSPWIGFENFRFLFMNETAWIITRNTLGYNFLSIVLHLAFAIGFALAMNEMRSRLLARVHQTIMFLPYFLSWVVVSYIGYSLLSTEHGFINTILQQIGREPVEWYNEPKYWPFILPIASVWKDIGYGTVIYLAAIIGFDKDYYEASIMDGATKWQQIRHLTLPMLKPLVTILTLMQIGRIFYADFGLFYQLTNNTGALTDVTEVIDTYVYKAFMSVHDVGMSSAAGFYQSVMGFILVLGSNYLVKKYNPDNSLF